MGTETSIVRAMCGVQLKDRKRVKILILMLGLNETMDQLSMLNSVCWYCCVLTRSLEFKVEG